MTNELQVLREPDCVDKYHKETRRYEVPGLCFNCSTRFTLSIVFGHETPTIGWECPNCGCRRVKATRA